MFVFKDIRKDNIHSIYFIPRSTEKKREKSKIEVSIQIHPTTKKMKIGLDYWTSIFILILIGYVKAKTNDPGQFLASFKNKEINKYLLENILDWDWNL